MSWRTYHTKHDPKIDAGVASLLVEGMNWPSPELATKKVESGKTRSGRFT
jgi:hypothetical protein